MCGGLLNYDWVNVPLVYTQVVTLAVYTFLVSKVFGSQYLDPAKKYPGHDNDLYVPFFTLLQFFFYMGWLKVAEALINPFGEDDDDFDMNWFIDRNIQVSYLIVDEMHAEHPDLVEDKYWDTTFPELPYTVAANTVNNLENPFIGATENIELTGSEAEFLPLNDSNTDEATDNATKVNVDAVNVQGNASGTLSGLPDADFRGTPPGSCEDPSAPVGSEWAEAAARVSG